MVSRLNDRSFAVLAVLREGAVPEEEIPELRRHLVALVERLAPVRRGPA